jgi:predicted DNA-binding transcriptional regulator YafY
MSDVAVSETKGNDFDRSKFNIAEHIKGMFGMFGGEVVRARLAFDNSFVNVVLDYFGKDTKITPKNNGLFEVMVDVTVSPVFLGWIFQFGGKAQILSPISLVDAMREMSATNSAVHGKLSDTQDT